MIFRLSDDIVLDDPRERQAEAPYTFFLAPAELVAALAPGDLVQAIFVDREDRAERMWVELETVDDDLLHGKLVNYPSALESIDYGDAVALPRTHVLSVQLDKFEERGIAFTPLRQYWDRCLVDSCILQRRSHVDYLYREEPLPMKEGQRDPDSGWCLRGTTDAVEDDRKHERQPQVVALGAVLNRDDRWLHLIDEPVGSRFEWNGEEYISVADQT